MNYIEGDCKWDVMPHSLVDGFQCVGGILLPLISDVGAKKKRWRLQVNYVGKHIRADTFAMTECDKANLNDQLQKSVVEIVCFEGLACPHRQQQLTAAVTVMMVVVVMMMMMMIMMMAAAATRTAAMT
jgi:hypothetical protein